MISTMIQQGVDSYVKHVQETNPLFVNARSGNLRPENAKAFLTSIYYTIQHTPIQLTLARKRARELGMEKLADFFTHKVREEEGHARWAESDLSKISKQFGLTEAMDPSSYAVELIDYLRNVIQEDPRLYLVFITIAESATVLAGSELLTTIQEKCGINKSMLSVIENHLTIDEAHAPEMYATVDVFLSEADAEKAREVMFEVFRLHELLCKDTGAKHDRKHQVPLDAVPSEKLATT